MGVAIEYFIDFYSAFKTFPKALLCYRFVKHVNDPCAKYTCLDGDIPDPGIQWDLKNTSRVCKLNL